MANILAFDKKVTAVAMLAEGSSIRAIERITNVHRDTIMRLGVRVGGACATIHDKRMRNLICRHVEVDELWGFIGCKAKEPASATNRERHG